MWRGLSLAFAQKDLKRLANCLTSFGGLGVVAIMDEMEVMVDAVVCWVMILSKYEIVGRVEIVVVFFVDFEGGREVEEVGAEELRGVGEGLFELEEEARWGCLVFWFREVTEILTLCVSQTQSPCPSPQTPPHSKSV